MKTSKYKSKKTEIEGIFFDSKKEAERYKELKEKCEKGQILSLKRQVKYILQPSYKLNGKTVREISYLADFEYIEDGKIIVEDVKSKFTAKDKVYTIKKKMLLYKYKNIEFREII